MRNFDNGFHLSSKKKKKLTLHGFIKFYRVNQKIPELCHNSTAFENGYGTTNPTQEFTSMPIVKKFWQKKKLEIE